jgi:hypothetical protein
MNMKRLLGAALLALTSIAFGATLTPITLLNPAGSTAGQAIVSTGASTAPVWGGVSLNGATGILPVANGGTGFATFNTGDVLVGGTGGGLTTVNTNSAGLPLISSGTGFPPVFTPLTLAGGGTSATTAAQARTNLGAAATSSGLNQFASTTSAQLAGVISDETGTNALVFSTNPTIVTPVITGVSNASNAATGAVGEVITGTVASGSAISLTTATTANIISISLTAGDWEVRGQCATAPAGTTVQTVTSCAAVTTSATLPTGGDFMGYTRLPFTAGAGQPVIAPLAAVRVNVSTTTTVFLVISSGFNTSTNAAYGTITARRIR